MTTATRWMMAVGLGWGLGWLGVCCAQAAEVVERYDDGKVKEKYTTDAEGRKHGKYIANFPDGKISVRGQYRDGQLDGIQTVYWESGKIHTKSEYREGKRHGGYVETDERGRLLKEQVFWNDRLLYPKSVRQIKAALGDLLKDVPAAKRGGSGSRYGGGAASGGAASGYGGGGGAASGYGGSSSSRRGSDNTPASGGDPLRDPVNLAALGRLNAYRYLCDVPFDVTLDAQLCDYAKAGADICARIGTLNHHPTNPGMPEEEFKKAYFGTSHANLYMGRGTGGSVDGYMDDSDPTNIEVVGHRRWSLNPEMATTGFGGNGKFSAMMVNGTTRKDVPDFDYICYPPRGFIPIELFGDNYAWHVTVNTKHYKVPDAKTVKVTVWPIRPSKNPTDADPERRAKEPLTLDFMHVDHSGVAIPNAIIFRPVLGGLKEGDRYWVEITGLAAADGSETRIEYVVEFFRL